MFQKTTIVIPTYNEAGNLADLVSSLFSLPVDGLDILVVDDNSPDGTGEIAEQLAKTHAGRLAVLHRKGKLGLGTAYLAGFRAALEMGSEVVGQMDADFSHQPEKICEMINALEELDLVIGSRYIAGGRVDEQWPAWRKGLSAFGNLYARSILGLNVRDATGGFRLWRSSALDCMPLEKVHSDGYAFQVEMTYLAKRCGLRIGEIPIYFADRKWGKSKMSFQVQSEAALRVWQILFEYRGIKRKI
jgi:dolichol-phosphate mannosyltransferase